MELIPISPGIQGLIFDCDGTLADTMPLHYVAWTETLMPHGVAFPEDLFYSLGGMSTVEILRLLSERSGVVMELERVAEAKEALARAYMEEVEPVAVVVATARRYRGQLPMAVASGGTRPTVENTLHKLDVADWFDAVVTADDVTHPKPAPDTFLEAARRLDVNPARCQVFEDTDLGLEAARRAGMVAVDVRAWL